ncbi:uncharacterized protein B0T23DRAFT_389056 [Neurospora hispaniola]|uniref:Uncharacterized protein n=1 Tax=Neurospora hispaniola TaxID=588809 RepID=A0AAJ0HZV0_9PEZI|nr:hypothetical protein B0T23DRAFT_389056 [Neurospora hispaniola]
MLTSYRGSIKSGFFELSSFFATPLPFSFSFFFYFLPTHRLFTKSFMISMFNRNELQVHVYCTLMIPLFTSYTSTYLSSLSPLPPLLPNPDIRAMNQGNL